MVIAPWSRAATAEALVVIFLLASAQGRSAGSRPCHASVVVGMRAGSDARFAVHDAGGHRESGGDVVQIPWGSELYGEVVPRRVLQFPLRNPVWGLRVSTPWGMTKANAPPVRR